MYKSTKTYGHEIGLSSAFRQHKAHSHCKFVHGYALAIKFTFSSEELDCNNWVVDFGGLKGLKTILEGTFDHKLLIAEDDPHCDLFLQLHEAGVADVIIVQNTGCEAFAELIFNCAETWLHDAGFSPRCRLDSVEVSEHGANSAIYHK